MALSQWHWITLDQQQFKQTLNQTSTVSTESTYHYIKKFLYIISVPTTVEENKHHCPSDVRFLLVNAYMELVCNFTLNLCRLNVCNECKKTNKFSLSINAFLLIFSLILCTFFMYCEISCIKNDKMLCSLLDFPQKFSR